MEEIWKEIDGYNGKYYVSNLGQVKSYAQDKINGKIIKGFHDYKGYYKVSLLDNKNNPKVWFVHRLVAIGFIPNPKNLPSVNHIDENKNNNCVNNLEWCTFGYNTNYGTRTMRASEANKCCPTTSLKIYSIDTDGNKELFDSIGEAERQTGNSHCNIVRALKGRRPRCGGRQWFYY